MPAGMWIVLTSIFCVVLAVPGCSKQQPGPRLLSKSDVGKVFIRQGIESELNFGKYLLLLSVDSGDLYAFHTFDIVDKEPVGKLVVSYAAEPIYFEIEMDSDFVQSAKAACETRMAQERRELWGPTGKPAS